MAKDHTKTGTNGWSLFIGGLALFLVVSLGFLTWLSISKPTSDGGLPGFALSAPVQQTGDITYYTYQPDGLEDYSVTIATGFSELGQHEGGRVDLERSQKDISGINVLFGYQEELTDQGVTLLVPYAKLAFDFEYKGEFYSGEVSNLQSNPSKKQLMGILEDFVVAIVGSGSSTDL